MRSQQDRTIKGYNLHICDAFDCDEQGWPVVEPCHEVPERLITFCVGSKDRDGYAHLFLDDYRFERLWNTPERYIPTLREYKGMIGPDFSTYTDMPYPMQVWNKYRSMALTGWWQRQGVSVVPVLQWSDERSLGFAFGGMPDGGTFCVSTVGVGRDRAAQRMFQAGIDAALQAIDMDTLLVYGSWDSFDVHDMVRVVRYLNDNAQRVQEFDAKRREDA